MCSEMVKKFIFIHYLVLSSIGLSACGGGASNSGSQIPEKPQTPIEPEKPVKPEQPTEPVKPTEPEKILKVNEIKNNANPVVGIYTQFEVQGEHLDTAEIGLTDCNEYKVLEAKSDVFKFQCVFSIKGKNEVSIRRENGDLIAFKGFHVSDPIHDGLIVETGILNDTGVTLCANGDSVFACSLVKNLGKYANYIQDAQTGRDIKSVAELQKVGDGTAAFDFSHVYLNGDKCVLDNVTGLFWESKSFSDNWRSISWTYTWYDSSQKNKGVIDPAEGSHKPSDQKWAELCGHTLENCNTEAYIKKLNKEKYCGFSDWRLPTVPEMISIVDFSKPWGKPILDTRYFELHNVNISPINISDHKSVFWLANPLSYDQEFAWAYYFGGGILGDYPYHKGNSAQIRAVRSTK